MSTPTTIDFSQVKAIGFNKYRLPEGYTEVKSVSSILPGGRDVSTLYVNLQVAGIDGCRIKGSIDSTGANNSLYGARNQWTYVRFGFTVESEGQGKFVFMHAGEEKRFAADTNVHFIDDNCTKPGYCFIDDQDPIQYQGSGPVSSNNLWLFNDNCTAGDSDYGGAATIYMAEFYKEQVLVCYPVPCVYHYGQADAVTGFYDIVNNRFLTATVKKALGSEQPYLQAGEPVNKEVIKIQDSEGNILWQRDLSYTPIVTPHVDDPGDITYDPIEELL